MTLWNEKEIAQALKTEFAFKFEAKRVVIDSRKVQKGDLFVAIKGENFDGNEYATEAIKKGAVAAIISDEKYKTDKTILAKDGLFALERLAYTRRKNSNAKIIGVTGSNGKTTVKELLAKIFEDYYSVHKTEGNLNNHIGLPLTLANMPSNTKIAILEMGMSGSGEISHLSRIAHPDIGIITNIGFAHIEFFKNQEGIARAKAEIFDWLKVDGVAVIPMDSEFFNLVKEIAEGNGVTNILSFGNKINNPIKKDNGKISAHIIMERYEIDEEKCKQFHLNNILVALSVAAEVGVDVDDAIESINQMNVFEGRGSSFKHNKTGATIINDAYNASPESMKAALNLLKETECEGNKIAVLGDMLELGHHSEDLHKELLGYIQDFKLVFLFGKNMRLLSSSLNAKHFESVDEITNALKLQLKKGDLALIKGSNGSKMWKIVDDLKNDNQS